MPSQESKIEKRHWKNREKYLKDMGFSSYREYLDSDYWISIRSCVLEFDDNCYHCSKKADCVHHNSYSKMALEGEDLSKLIPLCKNCHYKLEFDKHGKKRHFGQVRLCCNDRIDSRRKKTEKLT